MIRVNNEVRWFGMIILLLIGLVDFFASIFSENGQAGTVGVMLISYFIGFVTAEMSRSEASKKVKIEKGSIKKLGRIEKKLKNKIYE